MIWMVEGGLFMWIVLLTLLICAPIAFARAVASRWFATPGLGACLVVLPMAVGLLGAGWGWTQAFEAVAHASSEHVAELLAMGIALGLYPLWFACGVAALILLLAALGSLLSRKRVKPVYRVVGRAAGSIPVVLLLAAGGATAIAWSKLQATAAMVGDATVSGQTMAETALAISTWLKIAVGLDALALVAALVGAVVALVAAVVGAILGRLPAEDDDQ